MDAHANAGKKHEKSSEGPAAIGEEELWRRYAEQINALAIDASDRRMLHVFVEAAAWKLAAIAYHCGPAAAGHMLRQLGEQLQAIAQRADAQREADEAKAEGRVPH